MRLSRVKSNIDLFSTSFCRQIEWRAIVFLVVGEIARALAPDLARMLAALSTKRAGVVRDTDGERFKGCE
jgi:hypothetical protein